MPGKPVLVRVGDVELWMETRQGPPGTEQTAAIDKVQDRVTDAWQRAKDTIVAVGESTVDVIARLRASEVASPAKVEVEFGLGFSAKGHVIVAEASAEATLKVKLVYELPK